MPSSRSNLIVLRSNKRISFLIAALLLCGLSVNRTVGQLVKDSSAPIGQADQHKIDGLPIQHWNEMAKFGETAEQLIAIEKIVNVEEVGQFCVSTLFWLALESENEKVQASAARGVSQLGKHSVHKLILILKHENFEARNLAIRMLMTIGPNVSGPSADDAVTALMEVLKDEKEYEDIRYGALHALAEIGSPAAKSVPLIRDLLNEESDFAETLLLMVGRIHGGQQALPEITNYLDHSDPVLRQRAVIACSCLGEKAIGQLDRLIGLLDDKEDSIKYAAITAIGNLGPKAEKAVPFLLKILDSKSAVYLREMSVMALAQIAIHTDQIAQIVGKAASDEEPAIRCMAIKSIGQLRSDETFLHIVLKAVEDPDEMVGSMALQNLIQFDQSDKSIARILDLAKGKSAATRMLVCQSLLKEGVCNDLIAKTLDELEGKVSTEEHRQELLRTLQENRNRNSKQQQR